MFDNNKNGILEWDELIAGFTILIPGTEKEKLKASFEIFDKNGDGNL